MEGRRRRGSAGPPDPGRGGHPRPPEPSPTRRSPLARARSAPPWPPGAGRRPRGRRTEDGERRHPPRSMAATGQVARAAPPPEAPSETQAPRHNGRLREGGTMGRASAPAHHLGSGSAPPSAGLPPRRAHAQNPPTGPRRPSSPAHSAPYQPRPPTRQPASVPALPFGRARPAPPRPAPKPRSPPSPWPAPLPCFCPAQRSPGGSSPRDHPISSASAPRSLPASNPRDPALKVHRTERPPQAAH